MIVPLPCIRSGKRSLTFFGALFIGLVGAEAFSLSAQERETLFRLSTPGPASAALSPDGTLLAVSFNNADSTFQVWNLRTRKMVSERSGHRRMVFWLAFSPDGQYLVSAGGEGTAKLWLVPDIKLKESFKHPGSFLTVAAFTPDGARLVTAGGPARPPDKTPGFMRVWEMKTVRTRASYEGHPGYNTCVTVSSDGRSLYSGGRDGTVKIWDAKGKKECRTLRLCDAPISSLDVTRDGKMLAVGCEEKHSIIVWDLSADRLHKRLTAFGRNVRFSPDGKGLTCAGGIFLPIWEVSSGKLRTVLEGHKGPIATVIFSRDGKTLLTVGADRAVKLWDMPNLDEDD